MPGTSLADVPHTGPIDPQVMTALPTSLPYTVVGATTTASQIPDTMTYRVGLTLTQNGSTLFTQVYEMPQISLDQVTVGYVTESAGEVVPELLIDGTVVAGGPEVAAGSAVTLMVNHYNPGSTSVSQSFSFPREAGQYLAVGLDAGQYGDDYIAQEQQIVNAAATAARDGQSFTADEQVARSWRWPSRPIFRIPMRPTSPSMA